MVGVLGFSFSGQGQNAGLAFVTLKDWNERKGAEHIGRRRSRAAPSVRCRSVRDAFIFPLSPPPIPELGNATGFTFRLQDRGGNGHEALVAARNQLLGMAAQEQDADAGASGRPGGRAAAADRHRPRQGQRAGRDASTRSTPRCRRRSARATSTTSPTAGVCSAWWCRPMRRRACSPKTCCSCNAEPAARASRCRCRPSRPPAGSAARCRPSATTAIRRCASPATPAPGYSTGAAMDEMERLAAQLPPGFGYEWTGQSREEKLAGAQAMILLRLRRSWRCSCAWPRCTRAGRSRCR